MKNHLNKELGMAKEDNFLELYYILSCIYDNDYTDIDVKVSDHCYITWKYRGSAHKECNVNVKLNHKIPDGFHNLKNSDSHLITQELGKCNLKTNVITNGLENYMSFSINNKLMFIDSFQFLSSSLDTLFKNSDKGDFSYFS